MTDRELMSMFDLCQHLRRALHRSDCVGMAASVEARFPLLDSSLVRLAVNMPYRHKVRLSPTMSDRRHYFLRDKWVLRKVAERYLPADLARRRKLPFPVTAQNRMQISVGFFEDSFVAEAFGLSRPQIGYLLDRANQALKIKLLHTEVWGHVCWRNAPVELIRKRLRDHVTVLPEHR